MRFRDWAASIDADPRDAWIEGLQSRLSPGAHVLDLGCGPGLPTGRRLAEHFDLTGVDISERQIEAARSAVPSGRFLVGDMATVEFEPGSFNAVVALYSLIHIPNGDLPLLFGRIRAWLAWGGLLLATFGTIEGEGIQPDWLGVPMFFAGHSPAVNRDLMTKAGFTLVADQVVASVEPGEGEVTFHWLLAQRAK